MRGSEIGHGLVGQLTGIVKVVYVEMLDISDRCRSSVNIQTEGELYSSIPGMSLLLQDHLFRPTSEYEVGCGGGAIMEDEEEGKEESLQGRIGE